MVTDTSTKPRTLIVEDDQTVARSLQVILRELGHETRLAANVKDGMSLLSWSPEWIILDMNLPDGDGLDLLETVRSRGIDAKVALTSGCSDPEPLRRAESLHVDALFPKPINFGAFMRWLG